MESQPQNPEFRINPETFHPWGEAEVSDQKDSEPDNCSTMFKG